MLAPRMLAGFVRYLLGCSLFSLASILARLLDNWTARRFDAYLDLFARLYHDAQSAIRLDLWSFDG
jgi:hypothetical protein